MSEKKDLLFITFLTLVQSSVSSAATKGYCDSPNLPNGQADGKGDSSSWTGSFSCMSGFTLVGNTALKCRNGQWSGSFPHCVVLDGCDPDDLPQIKNGRRFSYKTSRYRGGVYKYSCHKGFARVGHALVWCDGGKWSSSESDAPVCAKTGCNTDLVSRIHNGHTVVEEEGAIVRFHCKEGSKLEGPKRIHCDGEKWSDNPPHCLSPASRPSLAIEVAGNIAPNIAVGDLITIVCNAKGGNPSPALSLYLNHTEVGEPRYTQNTHSFQASAKDNSASVMCSAINSQTISPITSEIFLNILFGPTSVLITPSSESACLHAKAQVCQEPGEETRLTCQSSPSNPPAILHWAVMDARDGKDLIDINDPVTDTSWDDFGWVTSSTIQLKHIQDQSYVRVQCTATNTALQRKVKDVIMVEMSSPPDSVRISHHPEHPNPGETVSLKCVASPSVPAADLRWILISKGEQEEHKPEEEIEMIGGGWQATSVLKFEAREHGEVVVECIASHQGLVDDTVAHVRVIEIGQGKKMAKDRELDRKENTNENRINEDLSAQEKSTNTNSMTKSQSLAPESFSELEELIETKPVIEERPEEITNEPSAVKDSKSVNGSIKKSFKYILLIICLVLLF